MIFSSPLVEHLLLFVFVRLKVLVVRPLWRAEDNLGFGLVTQSAFALVWRPLIFGGAVLRVVFGIIVVSLLAAVRGRDFSTGFASLVFTAVSALHHLVLLVEALEDAFDAASLGIFSIFHVFTVQYVEPYEFSALSLLFVTTCIETSKCCTCCWVLNRKIAIPKRLCIFA